jgi:hypothetical protein
MQSWADCITGTHESSFWKRQDNRGTATMCPLLDKSGQRWILARDGLSAYDPTATFGVRRSSRDNAAGRPYAAPVKAESPAVWCRPQHSSEHKIRINRDKCCRHAVCRTPKKPYDNYVAV